MSRAVTLAGYAVLAVIVVGLEVTAVVWRPTRTLGDSVAHLRRSRTGRFLLLLAWLWAGWHLFVRR